MSTRIKVYWENGDTDIIRTTKEMVDEMFRTEPWTGERWYITTDEFEFYDMTKCRKFIVLEEGHDATY